MSNIADNNMCQYICYYDRRDLHYIAVNMFRDIFGDMYGKPLYIENTKWTKNLLPKCKEVTFNGIPYLSLIKEQDGRIRYNHEIYTDSIHVLDLQREQSLSLSYGLLKLPPKHIIEVLFPSVRYQKATLTNELVKEFHSAIPHVVSTVRIDLGLIGSIAIDACIDPHDIDLVFSGDKESIHAVYEWFRNNQEPMRPLLQNRIGPNKILLCAFLSTMDQYPYDINELQLAEAKLTPVTLRILDHINQPYLNIQCYDVVDKMSGKHFELIVRDTLGRCLLSTSDLLNADVYVGDCKGKEILFVNDVEQQFRGIRIHY